MSRFFHVIAFGAATMVAPGVLLSQSGGGVIGAGSFSASSSGRGGSMSSHGDGNETRFTYNFPPGATVAFIAYAPYSGRMSSQNVRTLANGTHLNTQTNDQPMTYRDSTGRTRTDAALAPMHMTAPAAANIKPHMMRLPEISDPVAGFRYVVDDANRIAHRIAIQARPSPALTARPPVAPTAPRPIGNGVTSTSDSLGTQSMSGITVTGERTTTTYPPGTYQGNDGLLTSVSETWRSDQYRLTMLTKNSQPDGSESTSMMKDFSAGEPDPTLFMVPAGYQIVDETGEFTITIAASAK